MVMLDTNAVLRFLLRDDVKKADAVLNTMKQETCLVPCEVFAEIAYVLAKVYKIERIEISQRVLEFISKENVEIPHKIVVETALRYFGETKFDFVDCLMIGYAIIEGHQILTFDSKLKKILSSLTEKT
jgi:predicted nucleic-acid-binding protein